MNFNRFRIINFSLQLIMLFFNLCKIFTSTLAVVAEREARHHGVNIQKQTQHCIRTISVCPWLIKRLFSTYLSNFVKKCSSKKTCAEIVNPWIHPLIIHMLKFKSSFALLWLCKKITKRFLLIMWARRKSLERLRRLHKSTILKLARFS